MGKIALFLNALKCLKPMLHIVLCDWRGKGIAQPFNCGQSSVGQVRTQHLLSYRYEHSLLE